MLFVYSKIKDILQLNVKFFWVTVVRDFPPWLVSPYEKKGMENSVPPLIVSSLD